MEKLKYKDKNLIPTEGAYFYFTPLNGQHYRIIAKDTEENKYLIIWEILDAQDQRPGNACNWNEYTVVKL